MFKFHNDQLPKNLSDIFSANYQIHSYGTRHADDCHHPRESTTLVYLPTFLRYKREIFILGVLGILTTTQSFPKISEEVRRLPKSSKS